MDKIAAKSRKSVLDHNSKTFKRIRKKEIAEKGYKFFTENYIDNVFLKEEDGRVGTCEVKGRCYRSQKNETPHTVKLKIAERESSVGFSKNPSL